MVMYTDRSDTKRQRGHDDMVIVTWTRIAKGEWLGSSAAAADDDEDNNNIKNKIILRIRRRRETNPLFSLILTMKYQTFINSMLSFGCK